MKIAVCVKRVPDSETRIKIDGGGKAIDRSGVKYVLNPYDEFAVEEALKLKEAAGAGEVVIISVGDDSAQETIRNGLAMGADRGVLLKTDDVPIDPNVTAKALAQELSDGEYDLILFGKLAIDDQSNAVGPMVAEKLGIGCVSSISKLDFVDGKGKATREIEGGVEEVEFETPAVLTADKGLNEPRYAALRGIMMAKKKPLEVKEVSLDSEGLEIEEMYLPPPRKEGRIVGEGPDAVPELLQALRNEAKVI